MPRKEIGPRSEHRGGRLGGPCTGTGHMAVFCNASRGCRSVWYRPRCERRRSGPLAPVAGGGRGWGGECGWAGPPGVRGERARARARGARWRRPARRSLRSLFPYLPGQSGYNKRLRKLAATMMWLIAVLARDTALWADDVWVVDSTPVECGRSKETARRSDLAGWAEYGY